ncbi:TonB-dependent receptor [Ideonella sp.]|uniref:TonB-dependent receptor n=1 Tax=Ideonella sp. TaxID=1929293 RepID=UPI002B467E65|nr:TonB-dependent receptor [Ideonella sp.]HJV71404.1 TonB-dependent receptor [Ideonella sp.]
MKSTRSQEGSQGSRCRRPRSRVTPIAVACATLWCPAGLLLAQEAQTPQTVTVTGIRGSIESSIAVKRNSDEIVEAVTAEDIGKLPETSIAESLARLPGLTAQRVNGRDQVISIRGLAPKFGVTLLNGREIVSTGDNRSVEFDQFPAELIYSAAVYKTPDAALGAQGLSGTVNMKTVSPLSLAGRQLTLGVRGERNDNGTVVPGTSAGGNRLSVSYIDQFADRTVGLALGYAHLDSPNQERYFKSWWWGNSAIWGGGFRGLENEDPSKAPSTLQGFEAGVRSIDNTRDGLMAVLEYKPNKDLHSQLDLYYSKFSQKSEGREFQANLMPDWSGSGTSDSPVSGGPIYSNVGTTTFGNDRVVTSGTLGNVDPLVLMRHTQRDDKIFAIGWNNELALGDWKATGDLSYSKARRDEVVAEAYASAPAITGFSSFHAETGAGFSQFTPVLDYGAGGALQLRSFSEWGSLNGVGQSGSLSPIKVDDEMKALRLSAKRSLEWGPLSQFEGGVNYTDRSKDTRRTQTIYALKDGTPCAKDGDTCAPITDAFAVSAADLGFVGIPSLAGFDMMKAIGSGVYDSAAVNEASAPGRIWGVNEKVTTAFGKFGLDFDVGIPVRGNLGLQVVRTEQNATGVVWDAQAGAASPTSYSKSYTDVLPSLNLVGEVTPTTLVRFGLAKTLARPNLEDMRAGFTAQPATSGEKLGQWSGSGGNPFLEPWRATAVDLSVEKYFGKRSYVAAAAFHKQLESSIYVDDMKFDFTGFPNTTGVEPVCMPGETNCNIGILSAPINGKGGYIEGYELSAALDFGMLYKPLDGFGAVFSLSHNQSNLPGHSNDGKADLKRTIEGLSGDVGSLVVYYEKDGWSARVGQRYRSKYVAEVRGVWIDNSLSSISAERITDLQLGYAFETGALKGLSLQFQVNNLTNTPYRTTLQDDSSTSTPPRMMPEQYYEYGRRYLLGVTYKL